MHALPTFAVSLRPDPGTWLFLDLGLGLGRVTTPRRSLVPVPAAAPDGFHANSRADSSFTEVRQKRLLGFIADYGQDGWDQAASPPLALGFSFLLAPALTPAPAPTLSHS